MSATPAVDCMICDLYAAIDRREKGWDAVDDLVAELVTILPPRGHALHNLAIWQQNYRSRHA
jgi:hypothetical protein